MAEDKYALLRELLKEERGLFGKYYNQIKPSGGFTDYAANLFNEALEIRVCSLMKELLSERDALVKERDDLVAQQKWFDAAVKYTSNPDGFTEEEMQRMKHVKAYDDLPEFLANESPEDAATWKKDPK